MPNADTVDEGKTSSVQAGPLDDLGSTQDNDATSSDWEGDEQSPEPGTTVAPESGSEGDKSTDGQPTTEPKTYTQEEHEAEVKAERERREKAEDAFRTMQSRAQSAEARLAPVLKREREELEKQLADDAAFQKRIEEVGITKAMAEFQDARDRIKQIDFEGQRMQFEAEQERRANENAFYGGLKEEWKKVTGKTEAEFTQFMRDRNGYAGLTPDAAKESFGREILALRSADVTAQAAETREREIEDNLRRKKQNQLPRGGASAAGPSGKISRAEASMQALEESGRAMAASRAADVL